jgi:hypothetical protein
MNRAINLFVRTFVVLASVAWLAPMAPAATIGYLGLDSTTGAAWRSTSTTKTAAYDPDGDGVYGSDGYYIAGGNWREIKSALPDYIGSVTAAHTGETDGTYYATGADSAPNGYGSLDDPSQAIASTVADLSLTGLWQANAIGESSFFTITLKEDATFVLTTILGTHNDGRGNASAIKVTGPDSVTRSATILPITTAFAEYAFFKLSGKKDDSFTVSLTDNGWQSTSSGIAFETALPEPSATMMLISAAGGLLAYAWRKHR